MKSNVELTAFVQSLATTVSALSLDKSTTPAALLPAHAAMGALLPVMGPMRGDSLRGRRLRREEHSGHFGEAWKDRLLTDTIFFTGLFAMREAFFTLGMNDSAPYGMTTCSLLGKSVRT